MGITIAGAIGAVSGSFDILRKTLSAYTTKEVINAVSDVQAKLIAAHSVALSLQEKVTKQSEELRKLRETLSDKNRYRLIEMVPGSSSFAYFYDGTPFRRAPRQPVISEPPHYVCQKCFDNGVKSILQGRMNLGTGAGYLLCTKCRDRFHMR